MSTQPIKKLTGVWFELDAETNQRLTESARANKRSKRNEASVRLADHLLKFDSHMKLRTKS